MSTKVILNAIGIFICCQWASCANPWWALPPSSTGPAPDAAPRFGLSVWLPALGLMCRAVVFQSAVYASCGPQVSRNDPLSLVSLVFCWRSCIPITARSPMYLLMFHSATFVGCYLFVGWFRSLAVLPASTAISWVPGIQISTEDQMLFKPFFWAQRESFTFGGLRNSQSDACCAACGLVQGCVRCT